MLVNIYRYYSKLAKMESWDINVGTLYKYLGQPDPATLKKRCEDMTLDQFAVLTITLDSPYVTLIGKDVRVTFADQLGIIGMPV